MEEVIILRSSKELKEELKTVCKRHNITMSDLIRSSLVQAIKDIDQATQNKTTGHAICKS